MSEISNGNLLRSWKDISAYLGVDIRTCHRWEANYGMPVHRAEGAETRSPVFAYRDELDRWFRGTFKNGHPGQRAGKGLAWPWWVAIGLLAAALVWVVVHVVDTTRHGQPADFHIVGSKLIIVDAADRELWRKDMKVDNLETEAFYRANFQTINKNAGNFLPVIFIEDIDSDGDVEVLFALRRTKDQTGEGVLFCFDRKGKERWTFEAGRELHCAHKIFSPDYRIAGFYPYDLDGDGRLEIVVESFQAPDWPCQLALLNAAGKKIGEFWNAGYLRDLTFKDINGDGREELLVCGVNNEYKGGCLAVLDPRNMSGGSPQTGDYICREIGPGTMLSYVITPFSDVSEAQGYKVEGFSYIDVTKSDWIRLTDASGLMFELDFSLRCVQVSFGHGYELHHDRLAAAGKITSDRTSEAYREGFRDAVRYWTGSGWSAEPTPVRR